MSKSHIYARCSTRWERVSLTAVVNLHHVIFQDASKNIHTDPWIFFDVFFLAWRKVLKDVITYFREIQSHYEQRSKALVKLANVANNISTPPQFLKSAGIDDALQFLRNYNKAAIQEANKAKEIEEDVILALTGLRSDLQQKIKEIKHLSGDFKNSVAREMDATAKAVRALADVLDKTEIDSSSTTGKQDPYLMRLAVDRQVERQIDEENYLHQVSNVTELHVARLRTRKKKEACCSKTMQIWKLIMSTRIGLPESRRLWSRARIHRRWRNPKGV